MNAISKTFILGCFFWSSSIKPLPPFCDIVIGVFSCIFGARFKLTPCGLSQHAGGSLLVTGCSHVLVKCSVYPAGSRPSEPARRSFHKRQAPAQPHPTQDRGDGPPRHQAVRHLPAAPGLPRLRVQNPVPVPGDGLHQTRGHRWQQTQGRLRTRQQIRGSCGNMCLCRIAEYVNNFDRN